MNDTIKTDDSDTAKDFFLAPATVEKIITLGDRSLRLWVTTQEMPAEDEAAIFALRSQLGWFAFKATPIEVPEMPKEAPEFDGQKSLSERLRNVLYVYHQQKGGKSIDFEFFRIKQMEKLFSSIRIYLYEPMSQSWY